MQKILERGLSNLSPILCKHSTELKENHLRNDLHGSLYEVRYGILLSVSFENLFFECVYDTPSLDNKRPDFKFPNEKILLELKSNVTNQIELEKLYQQ